MAPLIRVTIRIHRIYLKKRKEPQRCLEVVIEELAKQWGIDVQYQEKWAGSNKGPTWGSLETGEEAKVSLQREARQLYWKQTTAEASGQHIPTVASHPGGCKIWWDSDFFKREWKGGSIFMEQIVKLQKRKHERKRCYDSFTQALKYLVQNAKY